MWSVHGAHKNFVFGLMSGDVTVITVQAQPSREHGPGWWHQNGSNEDRFTVRPTTNQNRPNGRIIMIINTTWSVPLASDQVATLPRDRVLRRLCSELFH